ncbi:MAG: DUF4190 domain-containing protein [Acidobacteria bacterium]|nr:DUF4190 domain-containing protein [Acidobacteriota bacterium]
MKPLGKEEKMDQKQPIPVPVDVDEVKKYQIMAKGSMIAGLLRLTCLPLLGSVGAIIQGIRAYRNLSKYGITEGQSNAMAGIGLGIISLGGAHHFLFEMWITEIKC